MECGSKRRVRRCFGEQTINFPKDDRRRSQNMITFWRTLLLIIIAYVSCVVVHLVKLILFRDRRDESLWPANRRKPVKTLIVMGSGPFALLLVIEPAFVVTADSFIIIFSLQADIPVKWCVSFLRSIFDTLLQDFILLREQMTWVPSVYNSWNLVMSAQLTR